MKDPGMSLFIKIEGGSMVKARNICFEPQLIRFLDTSLSQMDNEIQLEIFKKQYKMQTDLVHFQMPANWTR